MSDLAEQIAELRQDYKDGLIDKETYRTLMRALSAQAEQKPETRVEGDMVGGDKVGRNLTKAGRDFNQTNIRGNVYYGEPTDDPAEALRIYRRVVLSENGRLHLDGLDPSAADAANRQRGLRLAHVYVALNTTERQIFVEESEGDGVNSKEMPLSVVGACARSARLVLTGDPGGGKSTFLNHFAYALCAYQLNMAGNWKEQLTPGVDTLRSEHLDLIPLAVTLRDFAATLPTDEEELATCRREQSPLERLSAFVERKLARRNLGFVWRPLRSHLDRGGVWLLFDGLDEVTDPGQRALVRDAVEAFADRYTGCRCTVTCRVLAYQDETYRLSRKFTVRELDEFDDEQRRNFVRGWYAELVHAERLEPQKAQMLQERLLRSLKRDDLQRLAGNPLLLTIMALVNTHRAELPQGRARLYSEVVEMLLWRWEAVKLEEGDGGLRELLTQVGRTDKELQQALAAVAFRVHQQVSAEDDREKVADVSRQQLYDALAPLSDDHGWAQQMVRVMQMRSGLLVERDTHLFSFPHRTFQEYLAGVHLADSHTESGEPDFPQRAAVLADQPQWRTVILLAVGYLIYVKPEPFRVLALLAELCPPQAEESDSGWRKVWLAGETVLEMKAQRMEDTAQGRTLLTRIRERLARLVGEGVLTVRERTEAGMVLGQLGDPRSGVGIIVRPDGVRVPDIAWGKTVPAGVYTIGGDEKSWRSFDKREVTIKSDYRLAKYPVTVDQFAAFEQAPDFDDERWWEEIDDKYCQIAPPYFNYGNHPRENVNWPQAIAFCRWLSDKLKYEVGLPHEYEWEVAARYNNNRIYPWGNRFEKRQSNTSEGGQEQTTAVGLYPFGRQTSLDLYDMSGNVFEWCINKFRRPDETLVTDNNDARSRRGGAWHLNQDFARATYRSVNDSRLRNNDFGFRLVCRHSPSNDL